MIEKEATGISLKMLVDSMKITPLAALSRPTCGIRKKSLIITLPGSKKASEECLTFVAPTLGHAIDLILDRKSHITSTHNELQSKGVQAHHHHHHHHHHHQPQHHSCSHHHHHHNHNTDESKADASQISRRPRKSPYPMISVDEAQSKVLSLAEINPTEHVSLGVCLDHVLAEDIYAKAPLPPFPASIKDGYAVLVADGSGERAVAGDSTAGCDPNTGNVKQGTCIRVNTGAPVPAGADAVVQVSNIFIFLITDLLLCSNMLTNTNKYLRILSYLTIP